MPSRIDEAGHTKAFFTIKYVNDGGRALSIAPQISSLFELNNGFKSLITIFLECKFSTVFWGAIIRENSAGSGPAASFCQVYNSVVTKCKQREATPVASLWFATQAINN